MMSSIRPRARAGLQALLSKSAGISVLLCLLALQSACEQPIYAEPAQTDTLESSPAGLRAGLLNSDYTLNYLSEKWRYEESLSRWRAVLSEARIEHTVISDSQLEAEGLEEFTVLILPAALCLSKEEKSAVMRFLKDGRGVVTTGAVGALSEKGEVLGWELLNGLTDSQGADYLPQDSTFWVALVGDSPLSIGLRPGFRIDLWSKERVAITRASKDAYWSDWSLNPKRVTEEFDSDVALARGTHSGGRTVWFGFNVGEVANDSLNRRALVALMLNSVKWAGRIPLALPWYWPSGHQGAAVFSQDVEYLFHNALNSVRVLREEGVPGTFFCVSDLALESPALVRSFAEIGEVGSHSDDHGQFKGQPFALQLSRLQKSVTDLKDIAGVRVRGLRPPYELYDQATLKAMAIVGGEYVFGEAGDYEPVIVPQLVIVEKDPSLGLPEEKSLVIIRRIVTDDHMALVVDSLTDNEEILRRHRSDLDWIYGLSGLYMFPYHSNLYCLPERVEVLARMVRYAKTLDLWLATALDVSRWWRLREKVSTKIRSISGDRLLLSVQNDNSEPVTNLSVAVYLPRQPKAVQVKSGFPDVSPPAYDLEQSKLVIHPVTVKPNSIQTYTITLH